ncbi:MAG: amidohydrolase family protein [Myxococcales bacterium]|nr:amidohydrolase family protein [Myxococcales bacterium]
MEEHDLVVRGGTLVDGLGGEPRVADVAIRDGRVAEVGAVPGRGAREIDADGLLVTPGFVDIHTHYDGQASWDERLAPSSLHGVTTVVMGNCGVGFAPCRPSDRELLIRLMEGVEDIPNAVLTEGLSWDWETYPEFLEVIGSRAHDIDFAAMVPHGALRVYAMGERGANREPATPEDVACMATVAREAVAAGAIGFSTSRTLNHRTSDGQPTPTLTAAEDELVGIAMGVGRAGHGVLQVVSDFRDPAQELGMLFRMVERSGRPLSISLVQHDRRPSAYRAILSAIEGANDRGLPVRAQVCGRPVGLVLGLEATMHPFSTHPSYRALAGLPLAERVARLRTPEVRAALLAESVTSENRFTQQVLGGFERMFLLQDPPDYEQTPDMSVAAIAERRHVSPGEVALDQLLEGGGHGLLYVPFLNYSEGSLEPSLEMMRHPHTVLGLGDGGAHVGMICDGSFPTHMLTHWTRDRTRGERLTLPWVIKAQCADTARAVGLTDRGVVAPGFKGDVNVIDYDGLRLHAPEIAFDLPAGGRRLMQRADGYVATIVSGEVVYEYGRPTGALPGRLIRSVTTQEIQA